MSWDITREMILCCMSCVAVPSVATLILHALHLIFQQDFSLQACMITQPAAIQIKQSCVYFAC